MIDMDLLLCFFPLKRHTGLDIGPISKCESPTKIRLGFSNMNSFPLVLFCFSVPPKNSTTIFGGTLLLQIIPSFFGQRWKGRHIKKYTNQTNLNQQQHLFSSTFFRYLTGFSFPFLPKGRKVIGLGRLPFIPLRRQLLFTLTWVVKCPLPGGWPGFHGGLKLHKSWVFCCIFFVASVWSIHFKRPKKGIFRKLFRFGDIHRRPLIRLECLNISGLNSTYIYTHTQHSLNKQQHLKNLCLEDAPFRLKMPSFQVVSYFQGGYTVT